MILRSDQLILQDDPYFLPELDLLPINLDDAPLVNNRAASLRSASNLTPSSLQHKSDFENHLAGVMTMPQSASSFAAAGGPVGPVGGSTAPSVRGESVPGTRIGSALFQQDEARGLLEDDLGMQIDADGNLVLESDLPAPPVRQLRHEDGGGDRVRLSSDAASARVRLERGGDQQAADFVSLSIELLLNVI